MALELEGNAGANLAALSGAVPAALFAALMPPVTDLWVTKPGTITCKMVREAEMLAAGISVSISVVISAMVGSLVPFFVTSLVSACLIGAYEYILRKDILS
jgi:hypothetical protein